MSESRNRHAEGTLRRRLRILRDRQRDTRVSVALTTGTFGPEAATRMRELGFNADFIAFIARQPLVNPFFHPARRVFHGIGASAAFAYFAAWIGGPLFLADKLEPICGRNTGLSILIVCGAGALFLGAAMGMVLMLAAPREVHVYVGAEKLRNAATAWETGGQRQLSSWLKVHGSKSPLDFLAAVSEQNNKWGDLTALIACGAGSLLLAGLYSLCS